MLALILVAVVILLQLKLWVGAGGWREVEQLRATVAAQAAENARLQQRNAALAAEVDDLKSGEAAIEERARAELGMIKPDETFYRIVEPGALPAPPVEQEPQP
nr:cell division protein FtsB [Chiayiivirga flava]